MSNVPSDTPPSSRRKSIRSSIDVGAIAKAVNRVIGLHEEDKAFELPARLFEQVPFAIYICDRDGLVRRFNNRAAELWGRSPKLGDPNERFCGSYRMYRPNGSPLPHHECPMADVLRTGVSVRQQEVHIERPDGSRGVALVDIEAVKDSDGNIIGAVNCFQDITERKRAEEREKILAREVDHRAKNLLALVQATIQLTHADTVEDFKAAIEGRLQAISNAHTLLAQSRWAGANLHTLLTEELAPYNLGGTSRANIKGPELVLEAKLAQTIAMVLHELTTNAVKYGALSVPSGRLLVEWSRDETQVAIHWSEADGPTVTPPSRRGFGTRVVSRVVHELNGKLQFDWKSEGLVCEIIIPIDQLTDHTP
jgi:PAS domain S-box-containing protein